MTIEQKTTWLATLEDALYKSIAGQTIASLTSPDGSISYSRPDVDRLKSEINALRVELGVTSTTTPRAYAPIYIGI